MGIFIHVDGEKGARIPREREGKFFRRLLALYRNTAMYDVVTSGAFGYSLNSLSLPQFREETRYSRTWETETHQVCETCICYYDKDGSLWPSAGYNSGYGMFSDKVGGWFMRGVILSCQLYRQMLDGASIVSIDRWTGTDLEPHWAGILNGMFNEQYPLIRMPLTETGVRIAASCKEKRRMEGYDPDDTIIELLSGPGSFSLNLQKLELMACLKGSEAVRTLLEECRLPDEELDDDCIYAWDVIASADSVIQEHLGQEMTDPGQRFDQLHALMRRIFLDDKSTELTEPDVEFAIAILESPAIRVPVYIFRRICELFLADFDGLIKKEPELLRMNWKFLDEDLKGPCEPLDWNQAMNPPLWRRIPQAESLEDLAGLDPQIEAFVTEVSKQYQAALEKDLSARMKDHIRLLSSLQRTWRVHPFEPLTDWMFETGNNRPLQALMAVLEDLAEKLEQAEEDSKDAETRDLCRERLQGLLAIAGNPSLAPHVFPGILEG